MHGILLRDQPLNAQFSQFHNNNTGKTAAQRLCDKQHVAPPAHSTFYMYIRKLTNTHSHTQMHAWSSFVSHSLAPTCSPALRLPTSAAYDISDVGGVVTLCKFANFLPILLPSFILC